MSIIHEPNKELLFRLMTNKLGTGSNRIVNLYPTEDEILNASPVKKCEICGKEFQNSSACRLHRLKVHKSDEKNLTDARIIHWKAGEPISLLYHCPRGECSSMKPFDGLRNLRQHYIRSHTDKKFICELCGYKAALEKDINYHRKVRCWKLRKKKESDEMTDSNSRSKKRGTAESEKLDNVKIIQPIVMVVPMENVQSTISNLHQILATHLPNQQTEAVQLINLAEVYPSTSQPVNSEPQQPIYNPFQPPNPNSCERGTGMDDMIASMNYYDDQYGQQFSEASKPSEFGYIQPTEVSQSSQPETRNFGTTTSLYESNVSTRHAGTSMADEEFLSIYFRDTETQTMNLNKSTSSMTSNGDPWDWRMME